MKTPDLKNTLSSRQKWKNFKGMVHNCTVRQLAGFAMAKVNELSAILNRAPGVKLSEATE